jgi:hypothetical protein
MRQRVGSVGKRGRRPFPNREGLPDPRAGRVCFIVKVDALLTAGIAPLDQNELASEEGVEGVGDLKDFLPNDCITCSRLLI